MEARGITVLLYFILLILPVLPNIEIEESQYCEKRDEYSSNDEGCNGHKGFSNQRFILYDVNPPEGFNLRRDVYIRASIFVKNLIEKGEHRYDWRLVLPPWGDLYHWKSRDVGNQRQIPWGTFFDLESLRKFVPVIETHEFFKDYCPKKKTCAIDRLYILQNDEEMFKTGEFRDKNDVVDCPSERRPKFWGYLNITARETSCVVFHGTMSGLAVNLKPEIYSSVVFDHMEIPLHDSYGSKEYWEARRSMRYNTALYKIANNYRQTYLGSNDAEDKTEQPADWTKEKGNRNALGGPYLCAHLRRRDFLIGRASSVPTIKSAASQLRKKLEEFDLKVVFVATDAEEYEFEELKSYLNDYQVYKYSPNERDKYLFKDGGTAIVDQIICSRARYFMGTHESTFTFRIQEDREIIGFPSKTTFNRFCGKDKKCKSGGSWKIVWR